MFSITLEGKTRLQRPSGRGWYPWSPWITIESNSNNRIAMILVDNRKPMDETPDQEWTLELTETVKDPQLGLLFQYVWRLKGNPDA